MHSEKKQQESKNNKCYQEAKQLKSNQKAMNVRK